MINLGSGESEPANVCNHRCNVSMLKLTSVGKNPQIGQAISQWEFIVSKYMIGKLSE